MGSDNPGRIGTWEDLKLSPTTLVRLVVEGRATVIGKDKYGRRIYELRGGTD